ncbi:hypothetical protein BESB_038960 [Besnoitia besnoiti]|uniref:PKD/REJ-like domain-containing protein n=1 Tax=Besnoitia besnoiti TaxID=94643 RepID=A0A2A9MG00_BESBE|nr:hypothetical protein BESB_038960 [Besnoitia besnoiti]PFH37438.1 hypothetical protein BESB_038960 [Besnoitia besnoiti]
MFARSLCSAPRSCPSCEVPLKKVLNGYTGMMIAVPGEAVYEAAMSAKRVNPSLEVFSFTLRVDWGYNWVEATASFEYVPFQPYFSVVDGTVWKVKNDEKRFSFTIGAYACASYAKTTKWILQSDDDPRPAEELLEIVENPRDTQFTVSLSPQSLIPGGKYFITLEVSYVEAPTYKGSTTVEIDVEGPRYPVAHLQMPDFVEACDAMVIDGSSSRSGAPDGEIETIWQCLSGCSDAVNDLLRRQENRLMFTVDPDLVFALAKALREADTGNSTFLLQIQLTVTNSYRVTSTATSSTRIAAHLKPPEISTLTPARDVISHKEPYAMNLEGTFCPVASTGTNLRLDIRWTIRSSQDTRDVSQLLELSDNGLSGRFPAYSLKPAATYDVNVAVAYLDDPRVKSYASFFLEVRQAPGSPPEIRLKYPKLARNCESITLDATGTTSSASEPALVARWKCATEDCPEEFAQIIAAERSLALVIPDDVVYKAMQKLQSDPASPESITVTVSLEVEDRDMRASTEVEIEWSVSPDRKPFKLHELVQVSPDQPPLWAATKPDVLIRGLAYEFTARAFYQATPNLSNSVTFRVVTDAAGTLAPSLSLTGSPTSVLSACEGFSVASAASSGIPDDKTLDTYWLCLDPECPADYLQFLKGQSDAAELLVPASMVYTLSRENRQRHPEANTFLHTIGVIVINSDRRHATGSVHMEIENFPTPPSMQPAGPLDFHIKSTESVTMAVAPTYCVHADDATFMWEISSDFENRPSSELLTRSPDGHRATVNAGKLLDGVTYTVTVSLTYGDLPSSASLPFEINVAPPENPRAEPTAAVTGPSGIQGTCESFELSGANSQAHTADGMLLPSWNCLGQCPSTFVKAARAAKELTLTMSAATVYQAVKEYKERNPIVTTFEVEFELTVTDSQQKAARGTTTVTLQSSPDPPVLRATSNQALQTGTHETVILSAEVEYCEHARTDISSGLLIEWRSTSTDPRPFEDLFALSNDQLTATAEPLSLNAGTEYSFKLTVAYEGDTKKSQRLEYTVQVQRESLFLNFVVDALSAPQNTSPTITEDGGSQQ